MVHAMHVVHVMDHGLVHEHDVVMQFHDVSLECKWHDVRCIHVHGYGWSVGWHGCKWDIGGASL